MPDHYFMVIVYRCDNSIAIQLPLACPAIHWRASSGSLNTLSSCPSLKETVSKKPEIIQRRSYHQGSFEGLQDPGLLDLSRDHIYVQYRRDQIRFPEIVEQPETSMTKAQFSQLRCHCCCDSSVKLSGYSPSNDLFPFVIFQFGRPLSSPTISDPSGQITDPKQVDHHVYLYAEIFSTCRSGSSPYRSRDCRSVRVLNSNYSSSPLIFLAFCSIREASSSPPVRTVTFHEGTRPPGCVGPIRKQGPASPGSSRRYSPVTWQQHLQGPFLRFISDVCPDLWLRRFFQVI